MENWYWLALVLPVVAIHLGYHVVFSPLAKVPGPRFARLSRLWLAYHGWKGDFHQLLIDLHQKHGDVVRIGPDELSIVNPDAVRKIYGVGSKFEKSNWYSVSHGTRKFDLFGQMREHVHRTQRRVVNNVYSISSLKELEPYVDNVIAHFMKILQKEQGRVLDFGVWLQLFAFDAIGELTFSQSFGLMDRGQEDGVLEEIKRAQISNSWVSQIPIVFHIHEFLRPVLGNHLAATARNGSILQLTMKLISERKARGGKAHQDLVAKFEEIHLDKPDQFAPADIVAMAATNVFAGSDTTAMSLRAIVYYLLKNPECKQKLLQEVDQFFDSSVSTGSILPFDTANRMPYLQAVMYEGLRLHPAVGQTLPRVVPDEGLQCNDYFIPGGITVGTSPFVMSLSKEVFGSDAHIFRPERWLQEKKGDMQRFWFPFGSGSRTCIGKNLSWIEMSKLLPTLFRHFDLELADPSAEWKVKNFFFALQTDVNVILQPRKQLNLLR